MQAVTYRLVQIILVLCILAALASCTRRQKSVQVQIDPFWTYEGSLKITEDAYQHSFIDTLGSEHVIFTNSPDIHIIIPIKDDNNGI